MEEGQRGASGPKQLAQEAIEGARMESQRTEQLEGVKAHERSLSATTSTSTVADHAAPPGASNSAEYAEVHTPGAELIVQDRTEEGHEEVIDLKQLAQEADKEARMERQIAEKLDDENDVGELWESVKWLHSVAREEALLEPLKDALLQPLTIFEDYNKEADSYTRVYKSAAELHFLGKLKDHHVVSLLSQTKVAQQLAHKLNKARTQLAEEAVGTAFNNKFEFNLEFAEKNQFYRGLESIIGAPRADILTAMEQEHCEGEESTNIFYILNCARQAMQF